LTEKERQKYIDLMVENLPVLRTQLRLRQSDLAELIGISNFSISGMENGQRKMTWNTFMSLIPIFMGNEKSAKLMSALGIYTPELDRFIHLRVVEPLSDEDLTLVAAAGVEPLQAPSKVRMRH